MAYRIDSIEKVSVTTTAKDIDINYRNFIIQNLTADAVVYIKEKADDDVTVTADNGFAIKTGNFDKLLRAKKLSIKGTASADVRILYITEED